MGWSSRPGVYCGQRVAVGKACIRGENEAPSLGGCNRVIASSRRHCPAAPPLPTLPGRDGVRQRPRELQARESPPPLAFPLHEQVLVEGGRDLEGGPLQPVQGLEGPLGLRDGEDEGD